MSGRKEILFWTTTASSTYFVSRIRCFVLLSLLPPVHGHQENVETLLTESSDLAQIIILAKNQKLKTGHFDLRPSENSL